RQPVGAAGDPVELETAVRRDRDHNALQTDKACAHPDLPGLLGPTTLQAQLAAQGGSGARARPCGRSASPAPPSQRGRRGRVTPPWSVGGQPTVLATGSGPASMAGLPVSRGWVSVCCRRLGVPRGGPRFARSGPSRVREVAGEQAVGDAETGSPL